MENEIKEVGYFIVKGKLFTNGYIFFGPEGVGKKDTAIQFAKKIFEEYTQLAIKKNVFGAPTYIINDQIYWGQDRLDFVERHLLSLN